MDIAQQNIWLYLSQFSLLFTRSWGAFVNFLFLVMENGYSSIQQITLRNFNFFAILTNVWYASRAASTVASCTWASSPAPSSSTCPRW